MTAPLIKVKVVQADGTCRGSQTYINPPKTAREILERLQASGFVGRLQDSTGAYSLCGSDPLDDSQQYTLELVPSGDLLFMPFLQLEVSAVDLLTKRTNASAAKKP